MLWTRVWMETRVRLLLAAAMLAFVCAVIVLFGDAPRHQAGASMSYTAYVWNGVYKDYVRNVFVVLVIVLGGGTLLQECAHGTAAFTLSLPVSRRMLLLARAGIGALEVWALAAVPAVVIPALSRVAGQRYPVALAVRFALLWCVGGIVVLGAALLWASVLANEYVAWMVTFLSVMLFEAFVNYATPSHHRAAGVLELMNGTAWPSFDPRVGTLAGPPPWTGVIAMLLASALLLVATDRITNRRDFA